MSQIKLLKIAADGVPLEFDSVNDEITLKSGQFGNVKIDLNEVISTDTNGDLSLVPNGTGNLKLGQALLKFPQADGTAGQFLKTNGSGQLSFASQADDTQAQNVGNSYTAAVALAVCDALYISAADNVGKALGDSSTKSNMIGFAEAAALITAPVNVISEGLLGGFTGLTPASRYYLSPSSAGAITATTPVGSGNTIVQVGYAKNATSLQINIEQMGRRA